MATILIIRDYNRLCRTGKKQVEKFRRRTRRISASTTNVTETRYDKPLIGRKQVNHIHFCSIININDFASYGQHKCSIHCEDRAN